MTFENWMVKLSLAKNALFFDEANRIGKLKLSNRPDQAKHTASGSLTGGYKNVWQVRWNLSQFYYSWHGAKFTVLDQFLFIAYCVIERQFAEFCSSKCQEQCVRDPTKKGHWDWQFYSIANFVASSLKWLQMISNDF